MALCVCGEMASRPLEAMALIALGARTLSVVPHSVGATKALVRSLDASDGSMLSSSPLLKGQGHSLRDRLRDFARDHGIAIEDVAAGA